MKNGDYKLLFEKETFTNNHFKKSVDGKQPFRKRKTKNVNRIAIILGTHPEIIKMSPVIRACEDQTFRKSLTKMLRETFRLQAADGTRGWVKEGAYMVHRELGEHNEECGVLGDNLRILAVQEWTVFGSPASKPLFKEVIKSI